MLAAVVNNPRQSWLEYLGVPSDIDEWSIDDL